MQVQAARLGVGSIKQKVGQATARTEQRRIETLVADHANELLCVARRYSVTAVDAEDAFQSAIEKLLTKPPADSDDDLMPWLCTVVKNEAISICRRQKRIVDGAFDRVEIAFESDACQPAELTADRHEASVGREALLRINPDQARCLLLRADGMSYDEISEATGFNYAKVHRALFEGRRVYRGLIGRIDSGAECRRLEPMLSGMADGELDPAQRGDIEMHLENCLSCRATLRDFGRAPRDVASVFPVGTAVGSSFFGQLTDQLGSVTTWLNERVFSHFAGGPATEMVMAKKIALATAVTASVVAGGVGVERAIDGRDGGAASAAGPAAAQATTAAEDAARKREAAAADARKKRKLAARRRQTLRDATEVDATTVPQSPASSGARSADSAGSKPETFDTDQDALVDEQPQSEPVGTLPPDDIASP